jgi:hypothetical protein
VHGHGAGGSRAVGGLLERDSKDGRNNGRTRETTVLRIKAQAEGLGGLPIERYVKLLQECRNNCRAALQAVEAGEMLPSPPAASTRETPRSIRERGVFSCRVPGLLHCLLHKPVTYRTDASALRWTNRPL